ncbi:MAG: ORF5 protein [Hibiscus virus X]
MDQLIRLLEQHGFQRTSQPLTHPLVVHAIAGAGKTSCLRDLARASNEFQITTQGLPLARDLDSAGSGTNPDAAIFILDEYQAADSWENFDVLIGDPLQGPERTYPNPHFTKARSFRFGRTTCALLQFLGIRAESDKEDQVVIRHPVGAEPEGQLIHLCSEGKNRFTQAGYSSLSPWEVLGATFPTVTLLLEKRIKEYPPHEVYIACSRHCERLVILTPNAS